MCRPNSEAGGELRSKLLCELNGRLPTLPTRTYDRQHTRPLASAAHRLGPGSAQRSSYKQLLGAGEWD